jgi:hypothetical protein
VLFGTSFSDAMRSIRADFEKVSLIGRTAAAGAFAAAVFFLDVAFAAFAKEGLLS